METSELRDVSDRIFPAAVDFGVKVAPDFGDRLDPLVVDTGRRVGQFGLLQAAGVDGVAEALCVRDEVGDVLLDVCRVARNCGSQLWVRLQRRVGRLAGNGEVQCACDAPGQAILYVPGCTFSANPPDSPGVRFSCSPRMCERSLLRSSASVTADAFLLTTLKFTWPAFTLAGVGWQPALVSSTWTFWSSPPSLAAVFLLLQPATKTAAVKPILITAIVRRMLMISHFGLSLRILGGRRLCADGECVGMVDEATRVVAASVVGLEATAPREKPRPLMVLRRQLGRRSTVRALMRTLLLRAPSLQAPLLRMATMRTPVVAVPSASVLLARA